VSQIFRDLVLRPQKGPKVRHAAERHAGISTQPRKLYNRRRVGSAEPNLEQDVFGVELFQKRDVIIGSLLRTWRADQENPIMRIHHG
jgi:hypothetical protein